MENRRKAINLIQTSNKIVFLTGAGVSVPSGIPDYRSMDGVYQGMDEPEYLLSYSCLVQEPAKFYQFVQQLYHPNAQPNIIHEKMATLEKEKEVTIVTQNIDQLHHRAGSQKIFNFHGSLYDIYCMKCGATSDVETYLKSDSHQACGGRLRSDVVLYEEALDQEVVQASANAVHEAELIVIVGTSFKVYPFASLTNYKNARAKIIVVNREPIQLTSPHIMIQEDATNFFADL